MGMEEVVGIKSVYLAQMKHDLDLRVPSFFVISSEAVWQYLQKGTFPKGFDMEFDEALRFLKTEAGSDFDKGFSVSVRAAGSHFMAGILLSLLSVGREARDPREALFAAIDQVAHSWERPHAQDYRALRSYSDYPCHGIIIQTMVYGDLDKESGAGIYHTLSPTSGKGESGRFGFEVLGPAIMSHSCRTVNFDEFIRTNPHQAGRIRQTGLILQNHFGDAQEIEYTIESGRVHYLQSRPPDRSPAAAVRIALRLKEEGIVTPKSASRLLSPRQEMSLVADTIDKYSLAPDQFLASGLGIAPGVGVGPIALTPEAAIARTGSILVRDLVEPSDYTAIRSSSGIISFKDEVGAHTRSLALDLFIPAIANVKAINVDLSRRVLLVETERGVVTLNEGDVIGIDGHLREGKIYSGEVGLRRSDVAQAIEVISYRMKPEEASYRNDPHSDAEVLARGLLQIREWREEKEEKIKPDPEKEFNPVQWGEFYRLAEQDPRLEGSSRSLIVAAFDLLRKRLFTFDAICESILKFEETEPGKWGYKPWEEYDHVYFGEYGKKLILALAYLDILREKQLFLSLGMVRTARHGDVAHLLASFEPSEKRFLLNGIVRAARAGNIKPGSSNYFITYLVYELIKTGRENPLEPEALGYFMEGYWAFRIGFNPGFHKVQIRSTTVEKGLPEYKDLGEIMGYLRNIAPDILARAVITIEDLPAKIYWAKEILDVTVPSKESPATLFGRKKQAYLLELDQAIMNKFGL